MRVVVHTASFSALSSRSTGVFNRTASGWQAGGQGIDQACQAVAQGDEHAIACAAFGAGVRIEFFLPAHRPDQAAVLSFHLAEAGKGGQQAEFFHIGGVNRADQRLDQPVENFAAQAAADETRPCFRRRGLFARG